ncbi:MAG: c-type cytochrome [Rubrivivax sp.]|nr:c-type cytochrome [Rubrivivax sp.]
MFRSSRRRPVWRLGLVAVLAGGALAACGGGDGGDSSASRTRLSPMAALGEQIFRDASLSASGRMSCATCHVPATAHATNDPDVVVPSGGAGLDVPGTRNAPSLRYLALNPAFFFDGEGTPTGGFDRDGRAASLQAQAERPLLAPHEMANASVEEMVGRLAQASYVQTFKQLFGADILSRPQDAFARVTLALQQYQREDPDFAPFDSKYDAFLRGQVTLSERELRGLALFNDPTKGNCAGCHPSGRGSDGSLPLFTDFSYDNLGVPRNARIPANADPSYYDLGLCGPDRTDLSGRSDLCGAFKVPTLRNVAVTAPYFHNGRFRTLREALEFYVRRDTQPEAFYPVAGGSVQKFDDLPAAYHRNVNTTEVPYDRQRGQAPRLDDAEIDLVLEFLHTLTDGYRP